MFQKRTKKRTETSPSSQPNGLAPPAASFLGSAGQHVFFPCNLGPDAHLVVIVLRGLVLVPPGVAPAVATTGFRAMVTELAMLLRRKIGRSRCPPHADEEPFNSLSQMLDSIKRLEELGGPGEVSRHCWFGYQADKSPQ